jgi:hypothetical protein
VIDASANARVSLANLRWAYLIYVRKAELLVFIHGLANDGAVVMMAIG